ncbi:MAG: SH3 domain-containing protein [Clostridiales bacterium]|nr:SH3 domain-containing protein [Clostridiales bacterium]
MKQESRWYKQLKLKMSSAFKRKKKDDSVKSKSPFIEPEGEYGKAEDLANVWSLDKSDSNVSKGSDKRWPRLALAAAIFFSIMLFIFLVLPRILPGFFKNTDIALFVEKDPELIYDDTYRVVKVSASSVMSQDDITSKRITQVLMNEPVHFLSDDCKNGYVLIRTMDNIVGYVKGDELSADMSSCEPELHLFKIVVADISKRVMSHASNGTLISEVTMNTVLYADVKRDGVYQVQLPNGQNGWISSSGVIELDVKKNTDVVGVRYFVSSALTMVNATYLEGGVTKRGISIEGLAYVSAGVNGIPIPRELKDQINCGTEVKLEYDAVTGALLIDSIIPGDIVFLSDPYKPGSKEPYEAAICTDTGVLLMRSSAGTSIRLTKFTAESDLVKRIITVRRVFS